MSRDENQIRKKKLFTRFSAVSERVTHVKTIRRSFYLKHTNMRDFPLFSFFQHEKKTLPLPGRVTKHSSEFSIWTRIYALFCLLNYRSPASMHSSSFTRVESWYVLAADDAFHCQFYRHFSLEVMKVSLHIANEEEVVHRRKNSPMEKFKHKKISFLFTVSMNCWYLSDSAAGKLAWCWEKAKHNSLLFFSIWHLATASLATENLHCLHIPSAAAAA